MNYQNIQDIISLAYEDIKNCKFDDEVIVTDKHIKNLEKSLKKRWLKKLGMWLRFPPYHFHQRANHPRNDKQLNICFVREMFIESVDKYRDAFIAMKGTESGGVITSRSTDINIVFMVEKNPKNNRMEFVPVTIMKKKKFHPGPSKHFFVK